MKKSILLFLSLLLFLATVTTAQITVSSATFPSPGDTLRARSVLQPDVMPGPAGADQFWNFSPLSAPFGGTELVLSPDQGSAAAQFPQADLLLTNNGQVIERYYSLSDQAMTLIGYSGPDPLNLGLQVAYRYEDPQTERFAPLNYGNQYQDLSSLRVPIAWDDLPSFLTDSLDNFPFLPDSLAMRLELQSSESVDAWGELQLSNASYEVLRVKRTRIQNIQVEALIGPIWLDVTNLVQIPLFQQFQQDTTISYLYYTDTEKEPVATLTMADDEQSVNQATYLPSGTVASTRPSLTVEHPQPDVQVYPNPIVQQARFEFSGLQPGRRYSLRVLNLLGSTVWEKRMLQSHQQQYTADLGNLPPGAYLYALQEESGKLLKARRLIVVKP